MTSVGRSVDGMGVGGGGTGAPDATPKSSRSEKEESVNSIAGEPLAQREEERKDPPSLKTHQVTQLTKKSSDPALKDTKPSKTGKSSKSTENVFKTFVGRTASASVAYTTRRETNPLKPAAPGKLLGTAEGATLSGTKLKANFRTRVTQFLFNRSPNLKTPIKKDHEAMAKATIEGSADEGSYLKVPATKIADVGTMKGHQFGRTEDGEVLRTDGAVTPTCYLLGLEEDNPLKNHLMNAYSLEVEGKEYPIIRSAKIDTPEKVAEFVSLVKTFVDGMRKKTGDPTFHIRMVSNQLNSHEGEKRMIDDQHRLLGLASEQLKREGYGEIVHINLPSNCLYDYQKDHPNTAGRVLTGEVLSREQNTESWSVFATWLATDLTTSVGGELESLDKEHPHLKTTLETFTRQSEAASKLRETSEKTVYSTLGQIADNQAKIGELKKQKEEVLKKAYSLESTIGLSTSGSAPPGGGIRRNLALATIPNIDKGIAELEGKNKELKTALQKIRDTLKQNVTNFNRDLATLGAALDAANPTGSNPALTKASQQIRLFRGVLSSQLGINQAKVDKELEVYKQAQGVIAQCRSSKVDVNAKPTLEEPLEEFEKTTENWSKNIDDKERRIAELSRKEEGLKAQIASKSGFKVLMTLGRRYFRGRAREVASLNRELTATRTNRASVEAEVRNLKQTLKNSLNTLEQTLNELNTNATYITPAALTSAISALRGEIEVSFRPTPPPPAMDRGQEGMMIQLLCKSMGLGTAMNCKSGLDRTGIWHAVSLALEQAMKDMSPDELMDMVSNWEQITRDVNIVQTRLPPALYEKFIHGKTPDLTPKEVSTISEAFKATSAYKNAEEGTTKFETQFVKRAIAVDKFRQNVSIHLQEIGNTITQRSTGVRGLKWNHGMGENRIPLNFLPMHLENGQSWKADKEGRPLYMMREGRNVYTQYSSLRGS